MNKFLIIGITLIAFNALATEKLECKVIKFVGACNQDAQCGVQFEDNSFADNAVRPVKGMKMCLDKKNYHSHFWIMDRRH